MNKVQIITDSCSDLGKDIREKLNIDYVQMNTNYNGKETPASLDWEYFSPKEFYDIMRNGERILTTQVSTEQFEKVFTKYLDLGCDIVYIGCSLKLSGSVNTGMVVAKRLMEKYQNNEIYCIDSLNSSLGEGSLSVEAAKYAMKGLSAKEINNKILSIRNNVNQFCTVNSLDALKRAGRVKGSAAFFGNLFGVKPIIISDKDGNNAPIKKVKGRESSLKEIVNLLKEVIVDAQNQCVYLAHADCIEEANNLKQLIMDEIKCKDV
ncbi:MAG: DegV family protein [Christensenellales bacterium]